MLSLIKTESKSATSQKTLFAK